MKKGVVLLLTLFFITTISIIVLKNLKDTDEFLGEINTDTTLQQIKLTYEDIQKEVGSLIKKHITEDNIDKIEEISQSGIPFSYGDVNMTLYINQRSFSTCNMNDIKDRFALESKCPDIAGKLLSPITLVELINKYKTLKSTNNKIDSKEKVEFIVDEYISQTSDIEFYEYKNSFEFMPDINSSKSYINCKFEVDISNIKSQGDLLYDFDGKLKHKNISLSNF